MSQEQSEAEASFENASKTVEVIDKLLKIAKDNPETNEAARNLGKAALTISQTINTALLPLVAVNYAVDSARKYFTERFAIDFEAKAVAIPAEHIVQPKASVAGPAMQGLTFTHEEPMLKDMYLNLLARAIDGRASKEAHPAFVEIIRQVDSEEAKLLKVILIPQALPVAEIRLQTEKGWTLLSSCLMDWRDDELTDEAVEIPEIAMMVNNWVRLGLVQLNYDQWLSADDAYDWVVHRPEYLRIKESQGENAENVNFQKGFLRATSFGLKFAKAVGI